MHLRIFDELRLRLIAPGLQRACPFLIGHYVGIRDICSTALWVDRHGMTTIIRSLTFDVHPRATLVMLVARGLKDGFLGQQLLMSEDALRETMSAYQEDQKQKQAQAVKKVAKSNRQAGKLFSARTLRTKAW